MDRTEKLEIETYIDDMIRLLVDAQADEAADWLRENRANKELLRKNLVGMGKLGDIKMRTDEADEKLESLIELLYKALGH